MGICPDVSKKNTVNEVETNNPLNKVDMNLIQIYPSVCKIVVKNKNGTGFLIKLYKNYKELFCLLTNEHIIKKEYIQSNETIYIYYDYEKNYNIIKLNPSERFIQYNEEMDVTLIEIIKNDKIKNTYFLIPSVDNIVMNQEIVIPQFAKGQLSYSYGKIKGINDYELTYDAGTTFGSSGSPIFLKGSATVIGIHKKGNVEKKENYGILIQPIIELLLQNKNNINFETKINCKLSNINTNKKQTKALIAESQIDICKKEGKKLINEKGDYYIGELKNGKMNGKGKIYFKNGNVKYMGDFVNDKKEGIGQYFFETDEYYFIEDHKKFNLLIGDYYIGPWLNDKMYGIGKIYLRDGRLKYQGDFVNNKLEGYGKYIFEDGDYYVGDFFNNLQHGKGKIYLKNGELLFQGEFIKDRIEGTGKLFFKEGRGYFIGSFKNSKMHGKGRIYSKEGAILYELNFINGKLISKEKKANNNNNSNKHIEDIMYYSTYGITKNY